MYAPSIKSHAPNFKSIHLLGAEILWQKISPSFHVMKNGKVSRNRKLISNIIQNCLQRMPHPFEAKHQIWINPSIYNIGIAHQPSLKYFQLSRPNHLVMHISTASKIILKFQKCRSRFGMKIENPLVIVCINVQQNFETLEEQLHTLYTKFHIASM